MKIKFLGTAAAEAIPGVFCDCDVCKKSRMLGGKNIRTRCQALIDDKILIDLPADTYFHSIMFGIELSKIKTCLITHDHSDHLYTPELWCRSKGVAHMDDEAPLTLYATRSGYRQIIDTVLEYALDESGRVFAELVVPFKPFDAEGYTVTALKASHDAPDSVIYLIQRDGKSLLYAHDTGYFPAETVEYLKASGVKLDLVSYDCCAAVKFDEEYAAHSGHMNLIANEKTNAILKENGNVTDKTVCVVNHFSHNATPIHEELEKAAAKYGFMASYDGLEIEF